MNTVPMDDIRIWLKRNLNDERYSHTMGVVDTAIELAGKYGEDPKKAELAALLHDCAKCKTNTELLELLKNELKNEADECELQSYKTLHAPVGAYYAKTLFGINDKDILSAIRYHTIGKMNMTTFEKIIFLADKIEINTRDLNYRKELLEIMAQNKGELGLDLALLRCFEETIKSLVKRRLYICTTTIDVYNWLLEITKK